MKLLPKLFTTVLFAVLLSLPQSFRSIPHPLNWIILDSGLEYGSVELQESEYKTSIHLKVLKVDPHRYPIRIIHSKDYNEKKLSVKEFSNRSGALAVINGGFFLSDYEPLGLIIQDGIIINRISKADWGIFLIEKGEPRIIHTRDYRYNKNISQALQVGPRLVVGGKAVKLKNQVARRSALGITRDKKVVFLVSGDSVVYADDLAEIMRLAPSDGGLGCEFAINLDGGPSSQFYLNYKGFEDFVAGGSEVPNAIGVFSQEGKRQK